MAVIQQPALPPFEFIDSSDWQDYTRWIASKPASERNAFYARAAKRTDHHQSNIKFYRQYLLEKDIDFLKSAYEEIMDAQDILKELKNGYGQEGRADPRS